VFVRARNMGNLAGGEAESAVVFSSAKSQSEIYCVCINTGNPSQIVVGTSKGILELKCDDGAHGAASGTNGFDGGTFSR
jgi:hypothetical protein